MTHETIEAQHVRVGDRVWDGHRFGANKWCRVKEVNSLPPYVMIDLGHVTIGKHAREGVAVQRQTPETS